MGYAVAALAVLQAVSGYEQNKSAAKQATATANYNAAEVGQQKDAQLTSQRRALLLSTGSATAQAATSGVSLDSFDDVMDDNQNQGLLSQAMTEYNANVQKKQIKYEGAVQKKNYNNSATSSLLKGVGGAAAAGYQGYTSGTGFGGDGTGGLNQSFDELDK